MEAHPIHRPGHLTSEAARDTESCTLAHFSRPGLRVGYSELDQRRCPGQKVLKWVPRKVAGVYPCASAPCPPIARAGRKERLKPTLTPTLTANVQLVCVEIGRIRRERQLVPQENGGIWGPGGLFSSTPPPARGGKINTEFTKAGPVISPTTENELLYSLHRATRKKPGTLPLPCPRGFGPAVAGVTRPAQTRLSQLLTVLSQPLPASRPTTYRLGRRRPARDGFLPGRLRWEKKKSVPGRLRIAWVSAA